MKMMRPLTAEQLVLVHREFAAAFPSHIVRPAAMVAIAAVTGAMLDQKPVFASSQAAASEVARITAAVKPLNRYNQEFAWFLQQVVEAWNRY